MESKTMFMYDKAITIILAIFSVLFLFTAIAFIIIGMWDTNWLIAGIVFFSLWVILFFVIVSGKSILNLVIINKMGIKTKTILGKVIKIKVWTEFDKVKVVRLQAYRHTGEFICLVFNDYEITTQIFNDLDEDENIIMMVYTQKKYEDLSAYIKNINQ